MKKIQVVMLEPGREAYAAEINGSLAGMQRIVDGGIEALYPFEEPVCMICNEEGKRRGLPLNRAIFDGEGNVMDIIAGTAFVPINQQKPFAWTLYVRFFFFCHCSTSAYGFSLFYHAKSKWKWQIFIELSIVLCYNNLATQIHMG